MKVRQSASQMLTLSQQFPMLVGDRILVDDPVWNHFLLLLKICKIANSLICTPNTIAYLRILIEEKLKNFKIIYPDAKCLPKHHYMVHYPSQIERLGPSFMDNEAGIKIEFCEKNFSSSNFKNICKTVAKKTPFLDVLPVTKWPESTQTISHLQHEI